MARWAAIRLQLHCLVAIYIFSYCYYCYVAISQLNAAENRQYSHLTSRAQQSISLLGSGIDGYMILPLALRDEGLIIKRYINSSLYFTFTLLSLQYFPSDIPLANTNEK